MFYSTPIGWGGAPHQESQSKMFTSFLLDANRFCGVVGTSDHSKQVILVEVSDLSGRLDVWIS